MKIGVVTNLYPPISRGGAEQVAARVTQELYQRGHKIFVFSSMPFSGVSSLFAEQMTERTAAEIYRMYPFNVYHVLQDFRYPFPVRALWHLMDLYALPTRIALSRVIAREQPDVILTHNIKGLGMQCLRAIQHAPARHIHTLHDVQLSVPSGLLIHGQEDAWLNRSFLRTWYEHEIKRIIGSPDVVISPSKFLSTFYQDRGFFPKSRIEVLANPAPDIRPSERRARQGGPTRILFAGQLEKHKGILFLLESLAELDEPFELHIAGEGSLAGMVSAWAERDARILYHGFVSLKHLFDLLDLADVVVIPSLCYENSPTIIYESFQAGVPVIAADIGGVGELITHEQNGFLFEPGNREAFLSTLKRFVAHQDAFRERALSIRESISAFAMKKYVDHLEDLMGAK